jgi:serine phosphatase RsbU (regulator of sigma subunit)
VTNTHAPEQRLKIFNGQEPEVTRPEIEEIRGLLPLMKAFRKTTGWALDYGSDVEVAKVKAASWATPVKPGLGAPSGYLLLDPIESTPGSGDFVMKFSSACNLVESVADLLAELIRANHVIWHREAELAAGVPLVADADNSNHLAARLEAVLRSGAQAIQADAAALYLLNEDTSELKLRSCWGLPRSRLLEPARSLQGALGDLEAMLGHAVVLEDTKMLHHWCVPEDFPSAVCVPVSSPTSILGTLWVFCRRKRGFTDSEIGVLEMTSGRISADLEREMLMREGVAGANLKQQVAAAERYQRGGLPSVQPMVRDWNIAGWAAQTYEVGGDFFDWFSLPGKRIAVALGDAAGQGVEAAMAAGAVKAAMRSHALYQTEISSLLGHLNSTIWGDSTGDRAINFFGAILESDSGAVHFGSAGHLGVVLLRNNGWELLSQPSQPLGAGPDVAYHSQQVSLEPGESLIIFSDGICDARDHRGQPLGEAGIAEPLLGMADCPAAELLEMAKDRHESHSVCPESLDRAIIVIKRTEEQ